MYAHTMPFDRRRHSAFFYFTENIINKKLQNGNKKNIKSL